MCFTDRARDGVLTSNYLGLSIDYHKALDENGDNTIGAGFQGTYMSKRLDLSKVTFEDQLTPQGFTGVTSESFSKQQISLGYFDMNAGVLYNGSTNGYN